MQRDMTPAPTPDEKLHGLPLVRAALKRLEDACERLAVIRSTAAYFAVSADPGATEALIELDNARRSGRAAIAVAQDEWRQFPAPDLDRIMVSGWQKRSGATRGYWWVHEDFTDERGRPMERPEAELWQPMPAAPTRPHGD
ncbi:hypothetical protein ACJ4V0_15805 [Phreatobacter sp. HK31-P]